MSVDEHNARQLIFPNEGAADRAGFAALTGDDDLNQFIKVCVGTALDLFAFNPKAFDFLGGVDVVDVVRNLTQEAALNCIGERQGIQLDHLSIITDREFLHTIRSELL